jgi:Cys-tRNA(Pro)/Cys-tRNA(Cys) deacylase
MELSAVMKPHKTNAARMLDQLHIEYELIPYEVDQEDLSAVHVAAELGEPVEQVFKTILLRGDRTGVLVCIVPGEEKVDLKLAAQVTGNKKVESVGLKELLPLTGYIRGGCSPLGMKKAYPSFLHETAMQYPFIYVSAGLRGLQLKLTPADLVKAAKATLARIV